jgi:hypothetical protein
MQHFERLNALPPLSSADDDGRWPDYGHQEVAQVAPPIRARQFEWVKPADIPRREWVLGRHLIRKFVSTTVSPGGVGKSSLTIAEALTLVTGRNLIGHEPHGTYRVWLWNGEDPEDELQRRIVATAMHYGITEADIGGRLFVNSGRDTEIVIARQERNGTVVAVPVVEAIRATILGNMIDVVVIDPFVSCHAVNENDNGAINAVATAWAQIADSTGTAVELVHHSRKTGGQEVTAEDARGAASLVYKARAARVLNAMTKDEADRAGVEMRGTYFRVDRGKGNLAPPSSDASTWFHLASVDLGNGGPGKLNCGDSVGVVEAWQWPDAFAGIEVRDLTAAQVEVMAGGPWRQSPQSPQWIGYPIAKALRLDPDSKADRQRIGTLLKTWTANGMFVIVDGLDEGRRARPFIEVGTLACSTSDGT